MPDPTSTDSTPPPRRSDILAWAALLTAVSNLINALHGCW